RFHARPFETIMSDSPSMGSRGYVGLMIRTVMICIAWIVVGSVRSVGAQTAVVPRPRLHHVGLNSVDPERAIAWYLRVWPSAKRTTVAGYPAVEADMLLLFNKVTQPPPGAWRDDLHRGEPQSAFWHIGANINTTDIASSLKAVGVTHLPLFITSS